MMPGQVKCYSRAELGCGGKKVHDVRNLAHAQGESKSFVVGFRVQGLGFRVESEGTGRSLAVVCKDRGHTCPSIYPTPHPYKNY